MSKRRRFSGELKVKIALEALRGDRTLQANCLEAPGSSESGECVEASGDCWSWRGVLERGSPTAGP